MDRAHTREEPVENDGLVTGVWGGYGRENSVGTKVCKSSAKRRPVVQTALYLARRMPSYPRG